jgi:hypothetical protein
VIHVYPLDDLVKHEVVGTGCPCGVHVDWSHAEAVVLHRALDSREVTEASEDDPWLWDPERPAP